ncbi:Flp pilus assembly protein TadG [Jannaschia pohangensis]|uniref:Flp pilus assembly protein TadG n=1 Tax=Jannaschia pohangensis TaxID=390807 RepID=A0A1I3LP87_9RHOB|nr:Flp pilus assembly protein TadG [Jannaschia pohangensis]
MASSVSSFHTKEDGSLTIFGLIMFFLMMVGAGVALDIMRAEVARTDLQNAVDRAVLSAASKKQTRDAETVVKDFVRAAGLDPDTVSVDSYDDGSLRRVSIASESRTNSLFLDLLGVDELVQPISSEAREVRTELELSLVLDISGSMGGAKINSLRSAASSFVDELLDGREDLTSISLVPYNDRVNAGSVVANVFNLTDEHTLSNCVVFSDAEFQRLDQPDGTELQRMGHFDFRTSYNDGNPAGLVTNPNCVTGEYGAIVPWSNDVTLLQNRIAGLGASHWTAMDLGVKWGTLLLDPSSRDELLTMNTSADVPDELRVDSEFLGRPADYRQAGTDKVLVVMTDGVNTTQWDLKPSRKSGPSAIYVERVCVGNCTDLPDVAAGEAPNGNTFGAKGLGCGTRTVATAEFYDQCRAQFDDDVDGNWEIRYSVYSPARPNSNKFWRDATNSWANSPQGGNNAVRLDWAEVFGSISMSTLANEIMAGSHYDTRVDYFYSWESTHGQSRADNNLSNICARARAQGVVIFTIAFQAPQAGQDAMRDCAGAGNQSKYFDVAGLDIETAFDDILASVTRLRLSQ